MSVFRTLLLTSPHVSGSKVPRFSAEARNRCKLLPDSGTFGRSREPQDSLSPRNFALDNHASPILRSINR